ncbi:MAG: Fe(3+) ABC transporter substrate-binding protein, partial [Cyanobacteria bacterium J06626_14]
MKRNLNPVLATLPLAAVLALAACASPTTETTAPETSSDPAPETEPVAQEPAGVVNVYSARHYDIDNDLYESFTEQTGIAVNLVEGKSDELLERLQSDGDNSPADVVMS